MASDIKNPEADNNETTGQETTTDNNKTTNDAPPNYEPPSPLTGCYLLIIVGEPHSPEHKDIILQRLLKGNWIFSRFNFVCSSIISNIFSLEDSKNRIFKAIRNALR